MIIIENTREKKSILDIHVVYRAVRIYLEVGGGGATYQLSLTVNCLHANWSWLLLPRFFKTFILVKRGGGDVGRSPHGMFWLFVFVFVDERCYNLKFPNFSFVGDGSFQIWTIGIF